MLPAWLMIAKGVKKIADNQKEQTDQLSNQSNNSANNAFSTISSIYNNYLNGDKKKNMFGQIFGNL